LAQPTVCQRFRRSKRDSSRRLRLHGSIELTLTAGEVARPDALPVVGEREVEMGYNWSYGVTPPLPQDS
jgi:hypothetical protein